MPEDQANFLLENPHRTASWLPRATGTRAFDGGNAAPTMVTSTDKGSMVARSDVMGPIYLANLLSRPKSRKLLACAPVVRQPGEANTSVHMSNIGSRYRQ
jgi:hypothetical protein